MEKVGVFLIVVSPFLAFFTWAAWWLITDSLRERRQARAASAQAVHDSRTNDERSPGGQALAA